MRHTVVALEPLGAETVAKLVDAPNDLPGLGRNDFVDLSPLPAGTVRERGEALMARLAVHQFVHGGIGHALLAPPGSPPSPLYFHVVADAADALPWEQLYANGPGFCTLDARWPVGRIARRTRRVPPREFAPPLKIAAVLSAAGRSGMAQLQALLDAVGSADAEAVGARLHVISGEEDVLDAAGAAGGRVTAEAVPPNALELSQRVQAAEPDLLHVLCHGGIAAGVRTLSFASLADFDAGADEGTVRMGLNLLIEGLLQVQPWFVVLNACGTADPEEGRALAHDVAAAGVPAVVGMRRLVDILNADRFAAALYPAVLARIREAVDPAGPAGHREIDWAAVLTPPRTALAGVDPETEEAWGDPVLYVQGERFQVALASLAQGLGAVSGLQGQIDVWEESLEGMDPAEVAPEVIAHAVARIQALRQQLAAAQGV